MFFCDFMLFFGMFVFCIVFKNCVGWNVVLCGSTSPVMFFFVCTCFLVCSRLFWVELGCFGFCYVANAV